MNDDDNIIKKISGAVAYCVAIALLLFILWGVR